MYTMGTGLFGGSFFQDSQEEACDCVPAPAVPARHKQEAIAFMQKWVPEEQDKAEGLYEQNKADFPRWMLQLHQQHHQATQVVLSAPKVTQHGAHAGSKAPRLQGSEANSGENANRPNRNKGPS